MAFRVFLLTFLVVSMVAIPTGEALLGGLLGGSGGLLSGLLGLINIQGILYCSLNGTINGTSSTPVFSNALVQLQCGNGNVLASATTNQAGIFAFALDPLLMTVSSLLSGCNLVVKTPLSTCNAGLPAIGGLTSTLQSLGSTIFGLLNILKLVPTGFLFDSSIVN